MKMTPSEALTVQALSQFAQAALSVAASGDGTAAPGWRLDVLADGFGALDHARLIVRDAAVRDEPVGDRP